MAMDGPGRRSVRVSVVVPSFNHERFVERALRSILAQTHLPDELLVIDDGSTDGSVPIIERTLAEATFPAELIARGNRGLSATLNEGLGRTTGTLFAYLSSDDLWHPDRLSVAVEALGDDQASMAFGDCAIIDHEDRVLSVWGAGYHIPDLSLDDLFRFRSIPLSSTVTYRRSAVERFGWNEASPMEDYELYLLLASEARFRYIPRALGSWRMHQRNVSKDLSLMLAEALGTQQRVAHRIDLAPERLDRYQAYVRFAYGGFYLQAHEWRVGARLSLGNLRGAPSRGAMARRLGRVLLPPRLLVARQAFLRRWRRRATRPVVPVA
jgi:alpha-1,3-rhamnosyltransferase